MSKCSLRIAVIVEGHGEVDAVPILLKRIGRELLRVEYVDVLPPNRKPRDRLLGDLRGELTRAVQAAAIQLVRRGSDAAPSLILVLVDADDGCAKQIAETVNQVTHKARSDLKTACVVAVKEFETWFVAAAESLCDNLNLTEGEPPNDPEQQRCGKRWIADRYADDSGRRGYAETTDQPRFAKLMNLQACRDRCPSFDKLCRELENAISTGAAADE